MFGIDFGFDWWYLFTYLGCCCFLFVICVRFRFVIFDLLVAVGLVRRLLFGFCFVCRVCCCFAAGRGSVFVLLLVFWLLDLLVLFWVLRLC